MKSTLCARFDIQFDIDIQFHHVAAHIPWGKKISLPNIQVMSKILPLCPL